MVTGYGSIAPRTALGKALTMGYAVLGIPLMLVYLSSVGALLSRCVRGALARTLCCCLCSNCGYCCYDEARMQEKERRMRKKRMQQMELIQQQQQLEPFYVRSSSTHNNLHSPARDGDLVKVKQLKSLNESKCSIHGPAILAPVALCLLLMVCYICAGAAVLNRLEHWSFLDGSYFCFMSLSTIGFGDLLPGSESCGRDANGTIWFCSIYILTGMALTAMCFNILHDEIVHRLRHHMGQIAREAAAAVETLCSGGTPTSLFAPGADLVETGSQQLQQPAPVLGGVYTVREEDESQADTAEM
ncbi:potassium channel subfamily K member 18-like [Schistocerca piceifrons]|uniref:potassium channel subfamily K member 18-like n=1 Tax=Schistocerca piceifrons TaxID=274613 RepID=UPI001F5F66B1|nr:potassium channel subfamily K member 18-like [Schistocerca piceifrons]